MSILITFTSELVRDDSADSVEDDGDTIVDDEDVEDTFQISVKETSGGGGKFNEDSFGDTILNEKPFDEIDKDAIGEALWEELTEDGECNDEFGTEASDE